MNEFSLGSTYVFFRPVCYFLPKLKQSRSKVRVNQVNLQYPKLRGVAVSGVNPPADQIGTPTEGSGTKDFQTEGFLDNIRVPSTGFRLGRSILVVEELWLSLRDVILRV